MTVDNNIHVQAGDKATPVAVTTQVILISWILVVAAIVLAQLASLTFGRSNEEQSFESIVLPSVLFLCALTFPLSGLGIVLGRQMGLGTPLLAAMLSNQSGCIKKLKSDAGVAILLGLVLGTVLLLVRMATGPYLPAELPAFGHRGVIGGLSVSFGAAVAEEVWFRLGLTTILIWFLSWSLGRREVRPAVGWTVIAMTSVGFGLAHLPQLMSYGCGFAIRHWRHNCWKQRCRNPLWVVLLAKEPVRRNNCEFRGRFGASRVPGHRPVTRLD